MRRAEEAEVLEPLPLRAGAVAALHADRFVELEPAGAPPIQVDAEVRLGPVEVGLGGGVAGEMPAEGLAQRVGRCAARHVDLPRLRVAPRRRALRDRDDALDRRRGHRLGPVATAAVTLVQQRLQAHRRALNGQTGRSCPHAAKGAGRAQPIDRIAVEREPVAQRGLRIGADARGCGHAARRAPPTSATAG
jgi:hypothetical protein